MQSRLKPWLCTYKLSDFRLRVLTSLWLNFFICRIEQWRVHPWSFTVRMKEGILGEIFNVVSVQ